MTEDRSVGIVKDRSANGRRAISRQRKQWSVAVYQCSKKKKKILFIVGCSEIVVRIYIQQDWV